MAASPFPPPVASHDFATFSAVNSGALTGSSRLVALLDITGCGAGVASVRANAGPMARPRTGKTPVTPVR